MKNRLLPFSVMFLSALLLFSGCSQSSEQSSQSGSSEMSSSGSEKAPAELKALEGNIEMIVKTLGGPAVQADQKSSSSEQSSSSQQSTSSGQSSSSQESSGGSSQQSQSSSQQGQSGQSGSSSSAPQQDPMAQIAPLVDKMHYQWNNLMPEAVKKGASKDLVNNFDDALNNLSTTVGTKNKMSIMTAANKVYGFIPDLYTLFQKDSKPNVMRVRYYSRGAILNAMSASWAQAEADMNSLKSNWILYKTTLGKNEQEAANKLDLSIYELEKVIKEKNQSLAAIKGNIVLSNTAALEKAAQSSEGSESGGSESGGSKSEEFQSGAESSGSQSSSS